MKIWRKLTHFRSGRFKDSQYIISMVQYLEIQDSCNFTYIQYINKLKKAKSNYKEIKSSSIRIREKYFSNDYDQHLKKLKRRESEKAKWKCLRKVFGK